MRFVKSSVHNQPYPLAAGSALDWENVSAHLGGDCRDSIGYVENVTRDVSGPIPDN